MRGKLASMRKRLITPIPQAGTLHDEGWLDLDRVASVEVTSEEKDYGIESALVSGESQGWRAPAVEFQPTQHHTRDRGI
jgi:hypothetical protein